MRFGVREICDVVLKAKAAQKIGNKVFYRNEPVCYFDSLKTSSLEGAATTVYATGGRGNPRLIAWEGERTVTFTMEDALISPTGFMILSGAGLIEATEEETIKMHTTETTDKVNYDANNGFVTIELTNKPYVGGLDLEREDNSTIPGDVQQVLLNEDFIYIMAMVDGEVVSEPFIPGELNIVKSANETYRYIVTIYASEGADTTSRGENYRYNDLSIFENASVVLADYYVERKSGAFQVDITPDKFGGNFYLEASTLFRDTNGVDMPAEFIIPNCKVQSNFTFTMAATGDPSTFTFTMDAFPDYTRWNKTKKVLAAIQVIDTSSELKDFKRLGTYHNNNAIADVYNTEQKPFIEID